MIRDWKQESATRYTRDDPGTGSRMVVEFVTDIEPARWAWSTRFGKGGSDCIGSTAPTAAGAKRMATRAYEDARREAAIVQACKVKEVPVNAPVTLVSVVVDLAREVAGYLRRLMGVGK